MFQLPDYSIQGVEKLNARLIGIKGHSSFATFVRSGYKQRESESESESART